MRAFVETGILKASQLVWKQGFESWLPLAEVEPLSDALSAIPPEVPKPTLRDENIELQFAGPWRRFIARLIDLWAISLPAGFIVDFIGGSVSMEFALWIQEPGSQYTFSWLILPFVLLLEAAVYGLFGSTLGKALLGIRVVTVAAIPLSFSQYIKRQCGVYWYGLGTGFPLVTSFHNGAPAWTTKTRHARSL